MINDPDHGFVENQNEMKVCLLALILILPLAAAVHASDNDSSWSPADNGLRSRMTVDLPKKGNEPFFRVFIELQNVSHVLGEMKIRFDPEKITFKVTSKEGALLAPSTGAYDGFIVNWEPIVLPLDRHDQIPDRVPGAGGLSINQGRHRPGRSTGLGHSTGREALLLICHSNYPRKCAGTVGDKELARHAPSWPRANPEAELIRSNRCQLSQ